MCAALIGALAFALILKERKSRYWLAAFLLLVMFIDYFPRPIPIVDLASPPYVDALKSLPAKGGVLDTVATDSETMFRQIVHSKPVALGYISRFTVTGIKRRQALLKLIDDHAYEQICKNYDMGYLVAAPDVNLSAQVAGSKTVYTGPDATIYEMDCK